MMLRLSHWEKMKTVGILNSATSREQRKKNL